MQKGTPITLPLTVDLHITGFAGGVVTEKESGCKNVVFDQYGDGRWYATQRPGINQLEDASVLISDNRGRGAYYWDAAGTKYIVNNDTVYQTTYGGSTMTISAGTERVFIAECGDYLVILDQENNEGWTIALATPTVIAQITDVHFPTEQTPALQLARGGAVLNGKLYVLTTDGDIYESDIEDPTSWQALSVRNAEVEPDGGVYLAKHHEHIVAIGNRTTEFFQDVANPTGSTLAARRDVSYDIGAVKTDSLAYVGQRMYFAGQDKSGAVGIYMLDNFSLVPISGEDLSAFLTSAITVDMMGLLGSGFTSGQREFYCLTPYNTITDIVPVSTLVFSSKRNFWSHWDVQLADVDHFPLMAWMPSATTRAGEGILVNGDLVTVLDDMSPNDVTAAWALYDSGIYDLGIYSATSAAGTPIPIEIITGDFDGNSPRLKKQGDLWLMHTPLADDNEVTVAVQDDEDPAFDSGRTLSVSDKDARLNRGGQFRSRNYKVTGSLTGQIRLENILVTIGQ